MQSIEKKVVPIQPRNDMVLVQVDDNEFQTEGGIFLPGGKPMRTGTVRAVGPGALTDKLAGNRMPMDLKPGQRVYLPDERYRTEFSGDTRKWALIPQQMIPGVLS